MCPRPSTPKTPPNSSSALAQPLLAQDHALTLNITCPHKHLRHILKSSHIAKWIWHSKSAFKSASLLHALAQL
jgi:hypothetical protein